MAKVAQPLIDDGLPVIELGGHHLATLGVGEDGELPRDRTKLSTNLDEIWSMPKIGWKMIRMKFSEPASAWKWPTLVGLPRGLLLEP
jgi:hypothetical protein